MLNLGLSLSGGGFRATLFHLGVVRLLRDAGLLCKVKHICAISGGSILAGHLIQNWDAYNSDDDAEFEAAAFEVLRFIQSDLRGRIVRRMPYRLIAKDWSRRNYLVKNYRQLFRKVRHQGKFVRPAYELLTTNLTTASLCAFGNESFVSDLDGDLWTRRTDLPDLPTRVAMSSAFPAFFPPFRMTAKQIGLDEKAFVPSVQSFTDGGVFDNLGIRRFSRIIRDQSSRELADQIHFVILSDAGAKLDWAPEPTSGILKTVVRSVDVAMDRVARLDLEVAHVKRDPLNTGDPRFRLVDLGAELSTTEDPHPLHVNVQRLLKSVRTDLDEFTELEIRYLVQHGYCVSRFEMRRLAESASSINDLNEQIRVELNAASQKIPNSPPWNPVLNASKKRRQVDSNAELEIALQALEESRNNRPRLFSISDPISYLNALMVILLLAIPLVTGIFVPRLLPKHVVSSIPSDVLSRQSILARDVTDIVDLRGWKPFGTNDGKVSPVYRTIVQKLAKLKANDIGIERRVTTHGASIDCDFFLPFEGEFTEVSQQDRVWPEISREFRLSIPISYNSTLSEQTVCYRLTYWNNVKPDEDWFAYGAPYPIERFRMIMLFPPDRHCKHIKVTRRLSREGTNFILLDRDNPADSNGKFIWEQTNLIPDGASYFVYFEWSPLKQDR